MHMGRNLGEVTTSAEAPAAATTSPIKRKDLWVKLSFLAVVLVAAAWLVHHQFTQNRLTGWRSDLPAALAQAAREGRPVVAIIYDSLTDYDYGRLQMVARRADNQRAMDKMNAIRVATRLSPVEAKKYGVTTYPTTLLFNPHGEVETAWTGYIGETDFRLSFLKGQRQGH
jgi:hypothetical protein